MATSLIRETRKSEDMDEVQSKRVADSLLGKRDTIPVWWNPIRSHHSRMRDTALGIGRYRNYTRNSGTARHVLDRENRIVTASRPGDQITEVVVSPEVNSPARSRLSWPTYRRSSVDNWLGSVRTIHAAIHCRWCSCRGIFRCNRLKSSASRARKNWASKINRKFLLNNVQIISCFDLKMGR